MYFLWEKLPVSHSDRRKSASWIRSQQRNHRSDWTGRIRHDLSKDWALTHGEKERSFLWVCSFRTRLLPCHQRWGRPPPPAPPGSRHPPTCWSGICVESPAPLASPPSWLSPASLSLSLPHWTTAPSFYQTPIEKWVSEILITNSCLFPRPAAVDQHDPWSGSLF